MIIQAVLWFECPEEKVLPLPGHQYDNEIRMRQFVQKEGWRNFVHPCDWPAGRAKISSALHKKKITAGKVLRKNVLWYLSIANNKMQI